MKMNEQIHKPKLHISRKSYADDLVDTIIHGEYELICDQFGEPCIIDYDHPLIALRIKSEDAKFLLSKIYWDSRTKTIRPEIMTSALTTLKGLAKYKGDVRDVYTRIARVKEKIRR